MSSLEQLRKGFILKGHLEKAMEQIKEICYIYFDILSCRYLAQNYALFSIFIA